MTGADGGGDATVRGPGRYRMTVDLNVLDHLGINLYSNVPAVLTEAVANAWDADAERVDIDVDPDHRSIAISDDGVGMTFADLNEKYLRVGYSRRQAGADGGRTPGGRPVMGRKGLGKLSLFSIADQIEVQSAKNGERHGFRIDVDKIRQAVKHRDNAYYPEPLKEDEVDVDQGTRIVLRDVKRKRLMPGITALRKRLARRFSIIGESHGFTVFVAGRQITLDDRDDLSMIQFLWTFGESEIDRTAMPAVVETGSLPNELPVGDGWAIRGWLGTARKPKQLDNKHSGNLNGIVVFARGRLFHENILDKINDGRLYTKYLTGQIEAEFLDQDDCRDIATSDRQRIQEGERYEALLDFLRCSLNAVESRWTEWRRRHEVRRAKEVSPALRRWFEMLPAGHRAAAEELIAKLSALPMDEEEDRRLLYRHGLFAFERMRLRGSEVDLVDDLENVDRLLALLADRDALEAALYRDIVRSRLEVIRAFQRIVDENMAERVLQEYLFGHLWLLDTAWERATGSELIESRLREIGVAEDATQEEELGRVDIAYRTNAGKHIIVELKRAQRSIKLLDLVGQGQRYVDKLKKILIRQGNRSPNVEVVFVLGTLVEEMENNPSRYKSLMESVSPGSRIVYYDTLIRNAKEAYSEYLQASKELDRLDRIVDQL